MTGLPGAEAGPTTDAGSGPEAGATPDAGSGPGTDAAPAEARLDPAAWHAPVVGVIGGLGPAATAVFLDVLVRATDARTDQEHLDLLVSQHSSTPDRTARILDESAPDPGPVIAADAVMLERAGVDLLVLPCNTAHHFIREVHERTTVPFISIVECTAEAAAAAVAGTGRPVAVFATEGNVRADVYQDALRDAGTTSWVPPREMQDRLNTIIYDQVKANRPVDRDLFVSCVEDALALGAGTVVLGCTELSVVYDQQGLRGDPRLIDSLTELARRTIGAAGRTLTPDFA